MVFSCWCLLFVANSTIDHESCQLCVSWCLMYDRIRIVIEQRGDLVAKEIAVDLSEGNDIPLGSRIRLRRQQQQVRLSTMARDIGYNRGYLSKVENNHVSPSDDLLGIIAQYLKTTVNDLAETPISDLVPERPQGKRVQRRRGFALGAPKRSEKEETDSYETQQRMLGERIERLIKMAHLTEAEREMIEGRLVAVASELLKLVKDSRRLR